MQTGAAAVVQDETYLDELTPGQTLLRGQYRIERYLNSGGFGITYLARDSLDRLVVIKECYPGALCHRQDATVRPRSRTLHGEFRAMVSLFLREARNLAKLRHSNIVGVHQVFEDNATAYMALDLVEGRDLLEIIEDGADSLKPADVQRILLHLLDAIAFMHGQDILHRDISPDNILITTKGDPVLIDFGSAREEATKASRVLTGLLMVKDGYSPQEFYIAHSKQLPCSDLYALGATFYHVITGAAPPDSQARLAAIATGDRDPYQALSGRFGAYDVAFLAAIDRAMNVFPADRIQTAEDWVRAIDPARRQQAALADAHRDQSIEISITRLVNEANAAAQTTAAPVSVAVAADPPSPRVLEYIGFDDDETHHQPDDQLGAAPVIEPTVPPSSGWPKRMLRAALIAGLIGAGGTLLAPAGQKVMRAVLLSVAATTPIIVQS
jgi:serine/threonine protein kinase